MGDLVDLVAYGTRCAFLAFVGLSIAGGLGLLLVGALSALHRAIGLVLNFAVLIEAAREASRQGRPLRSVKARGWWERRRP